MAADAPSVTTATSEGYFANLVDLGRPPVVGLVEPARELARIERERAALLASVKGGADAGILDGSSSAGTH
jgi:hypothetical protein